VEKTDREKILKKLRLANGLFELAMRVKSTQIRRKHPDWTEAQVRAGTLRLIEAGCR
jgi:hypothetical protein